MMESSFNHDIDHSYLSKFELIPYCISFNNIANNRIEDYLQDQITKCPCSKQKIDEKICYNSKCINYSTQTECVDCNPQYCQNQRIYRQLNAKLTVKHTVQKGYGLFADEDLKKKQFLMEYVGEIINKIEFTKRLTEYMVKSEHQYIMQLKSNTYLDASRKGSISRFINHSCEPNCIVEVWNVRDYLRVGIFTLCDIEKGTELTFDYQWKLSQRAPTKCYCGTKSCRGYLEVLTPEQLELLKIRKGLWRKGGAPITTNTTITSPPKQSVPDDHHMNTFEDTIDHIAIKGGNITEEQVALDELDTPSIDIIKEDNHSNQNTEDRILPLLPEDNSDVANTNTANHTTMANVSTTVDIYDEHTGKLVRNRIIGKRIKIWWEGNLAYLEADVVSYNTDTQKYVCKYISDDSIYDEDLENNNEADMKWYWLDETVEERVIRKKQLNHLAINADEEYADESNYTILGNRNRPHHDRDIENYPAREDETSPISSTHSSFVPPPPSAATTTATVGIATVNAYSKDDEVIRHNLSLSANTANILIEEFNNIQQVNKCFIIWQTLQSLLEGSFEVKIPNSSLRLEAPEHLDRELVIIGKELQINELLSAIDEVISNYKIDATMKMDTLIRSKQGILLTNDWRLKLPIPQNNQSKMNNKNIEEYQKILSNIPMKISNNLLNYKYLPSYVECYEEINRYIQGNAGIVMAQYPPQYANNIIAALPVNGKCASDAVKLTMVNNLKGLTNRLGLSSQPSVHALSLLLRYIERYATDSIIRESTAVLAAIALIVIKLYSGVGAGVQLNFKFKMTKHIIRSAYCQVFNREEADVTCASMEPYISAALEKEYMIYALFLKYDIYQPSLFPRLYSSVCLNMWLDELNSDLQTTAKLLKDVSKEKHKSKKHTSSGSRSVKSTIDETVTNNAFVLAILREGEELMHEVVYQHTELLLALPIEYLEFICILYVAILQLILPSTQIHRIVITANHRMIMRILYVAIEIQGFHRAAIDWGIALFGNIISSDFNFSPSSSKNTSATALTAVFDELETFREFKANYNVEKNTTHIGEYILRVSVRNILNQHYMQGCQDIPFDMITSILEMKYVPSIPIYIANHHNTLESPVESDITTEGLVCKTRFPWLLPSDPNMSDAIQITPVINLAYPSLSSTDEYLSGTITHSNNTMIEDVVQEDKRISHFSIYKAEDLAQASIENPSPPQVFTKLISVNKAADLYTGSTLTINNSTCFMEVTEAMRMGNKEISSKLKKHRTSRQQETAIGWSEIMLSFRSWPNAKQLQKEVLRAGKTVDDIIQIGLIANVITELTLFQKLHYDYPNHQNNSLSNPSHNPSQYSSSSCPYFIDPIGIIKLNTEDFKLNPNLHDIIIDNKKRSTHINSNNNSPIELTFLAFQPVQITLSTIIDTLSSSSSTNTSSSNSNVIDPVFAMELVKDLLCAGEHLISCGIYLKWLSLDHIYVTASGRLVIGSLAGAILNNHCKYPSIHNRSNSSNSNNNVVSGEKNQVHELNSIAILIETITQNEIKNKEKSLHKSKDKNRRKRRIYEDDEEEDDEDDAPSASKKSSIPANALFSVAPEILLGGSATAESTLYTIGTICAVAIMGRAIIKNASAEDKQIQYIYRTLGTPRAMGYDLTELESLPMTKKYGTQIVDKEDNYTESRSRLYKTIKEQCCKEILQLYSSKENFNPNNTTIQKNINRTNILLYPTVSIEDTRVAVNPIETDYEGVIDLIKASLHLIPIKRIPIHLLFQYQILTSIPKLAGNTIKWKPSDFESESKFLSCGISCNLINIRTKLRTDSMKELIERIRIHQKKKHPNSSLIDDACSVDELLYNGTINKIEQMYHNHNHNNSPQMQQQQQSFVPTHNSVSQHLPPPPRIYQPHSFTTQQPQPQPQLQYPPILSGQGSQHWEGSRRELGGANSSNNYNHNNNNNNSNNNNTSFSYNKFSSQNLPVPPSSYYPPPPKLPPNIQQLSKQLSYQQSPPEIPNLLSNHLNKQNIQYPSTITVTSNVLPPTIPPPPPSSRYSESIMTATIASSATKEDYQSQNNKRTYYDSKL